MASCKTSAVVGQVVGKRSILGAEAAGLSHWLYLNMEGKERAKMTPTFLAGASAWMKGPFTEMGKLEEELIEGSGLGGSRLQL